MCSEMIKNRINQSLSKLYIENDNGRKIPFVCILCDRLIAPDSVATISVELLAKYQDKLQINDLCSIPQSLIDCYQIYCPITYDEAQTSNSFDISSLMLSPRATYLQYDDQRIGDGFSVCQQCFKSLSHGYIPKFCIANNYLFGTTPDCLLQLTDIELAMITPVKTYGYCFSYTGGIQKQLKGSLSYYRVKKESIVRAVAHFDALDISNNVVVLLYGQMTKEQHKRAKKKNKINTQNVLKAVQWLLHNNVEWQKNNINYEDVVNSLKNPTLIDCHKNATEEEHDSEHNYSLENTESFQVFFPDSSITTTTGGQQNIDDFQEIVKEAAKNGSDIEIRCDLYKEAVSDYKDNNLINSCLLQFPYGRGSMNEQRFKPDGRETDCVDISEYIQYLSLQSQPQFHRELFTLILYNMQIKQTMVKSAAWRVRKKVDAHFLANELTMDDIEKAIESTKYARGAKTQEVLRGRKLLGAIDAISKSIPHTNEAARFGRRQAESIQHHFGCPTFFLTVTPDDDNSFIIQIYSQQIIDTDEIVSNLTDQELFVRAQKRTQLRIMFPGICAYFFEQVLKIIIKDVIGWDSETQCYNEQSPGLFGHVDAFTATVEEQGRHTLHAHFLIWTSEFNRLREQLYTGSMHIRNKAKTMICKKVDEICSTLCFFNDMNNGLNYKAFDHECSMPIANMRKNPTVVADQELRYLRCKRKHSAIFAFCEHCNKSWTSEQLLEDYLKKRIQVPHLNSFPDNDVRRLKSLAIQYQKSTDDDEISKFIVDAAYNNHVHTPSCFKLCKADNPFQTNANQNYECRYRYPKKRRTKTIIQNAAETTVKWYEWNGSCKERHIKEVIPKRKAYDAFQNAYCPAISYSKLTCNTNIAFVMPGPIAQYCFMYATKGTQKDDTEEYESVKIASQKILSRLKKYEKETSESIRRLLATSFAHQANNIVGASLASYLTRNKQRFIFSHSFVWCPIRDIKSLLLGEKICTNVSFKQNMTYFECSALHYICRPSELENLSPFQFYSAYEVVKATEYNEDKLLFFCNKNHFIHPSYQYEKDSFQQGVRERKQKYLVKIQQYDFPDTASFVQNLMDENNEINEFMEEYSEQVLLVFYSFRTIEDLMIDSSFTRKLQYAISNKKIDDNALQFLQNLQDCKSNSFRMAIQNDDLQRTTIPLHAAQADHEYYTQELNVNHPVPSQDEFDVDAFLDTLTEDISEDNNNAADDYECIPKGYSTKVLREKGKHGCGFNCLPSITTGTLLQENFLEVSNDCIVTEQDLPEEENDETIHRHDTPTQKDIVSVIVSQNKTEPRSFQAITGDLTIVDVMSANGSAKSIIDWGMKAKFDVMQRRAFEIITGSLVLSIFYEAPKILGARNLFQKERRRLQILVDESKRNGPQLICFLHGPAGSGKTAIIDLVVTYVNEYCKSLFTFENLARTIVVTAMTGVAATLFQGQTTHAALYLNQKRAIESEQIELWLSTKLLIIDEISFASKEDITMIDNKLRRLKQNLNSKYGGIHIIFCGDMRQLEPVGQFKKPIYAEDVPEFKDWINCYIELRGMHRFQEDPEYGLLLMRFRNGTLTPQDIQTINNRVALSQQNLPENVRYATFFNRDRDSINTAIFEERAKHFYNINHNTNGFIMIFSDNIEVKNSAKVFIPFPRRSLFWEKCGEDDIKMARGRMDPVLKLNVGGRVMITTNTNVTNGLANGTQATVQKIVLKPNQQGTIVYLDNNVPITAVLASQVDYVELKHLNERVQPQTFILNPKQHTFKAVIPKSKLLQHIDPKNKTEMIDMRAIQIPIVLNNATTGHKLQGCGVDSLFIHNWSYVTNWVYVMLSRVKTYDGLFARKLLNEDVKKYAVPESLERMIQKFNVLTPRKLSKKDFDQIMERNTTKNI